MAGFPGGLVRWADEVGSTQSEMVGIARAGGADGLVLVADHQTAGQGRRGREWTSRPGCSLLVSVLLPTADRRTPLMAGLAATDAASAVAGVRIVLKWPNDLVSDVPADKDEEEKKLGGILVDVVGDRAVVGLGLNVAWPSDLPPGATDLGRLSGRVVDRAALLEAFLDALGHWSGQSAERVVEGYAARCCTLGRTVRVDRAAQSPLEGRALALAASGQLVVEDDDGRRHEVSAGDVVHLRRGPNR